MSKYVLIKCETSRVGCDSENVYEFPDHFTDDEINTYANEYARDNAEMYGIIEDEEESCNEAGIEFEEDSCYRATIKVLDMTREEIEEEYGDITKA
jgi:hypothetical protein